MLKGRGRKMFLSCSSGVQRIDDGAGEKLGMWCGTYLTASIFGLISCMEGRRR